MPTIFRRIGVILPVILSLSLLAAGCEDDPILTPGSAEEKSGGSYGRIDKLGVDPAVNGAAPSVMADPEENPELF